MIRLIKHTLMFFLMYNLCSGQQYNISATGQVNMIKPLSITSINSTINFGEIILSGSNFIKSLSPSEGAIFKIEGHPNRNVIISFNPVTLSNSEWVAQNGGTLGTLNFEANVVHTGANSSYQSPVSVQNGNSYQLVNSSGIGILYLWVGGSINIQANQPVGDYQGIFSIMVSYQ